MVKSISLIRSCEVSGVAVAEFSFLRGTVNKKERNWM